MKLTIRRAGPSDWAAIARICADTGAAGEPVEGPEREAFAEHWVGPYRELRPDWTWVAVVDKAVVGYLTGCPDTLGFEKERRRLFAPGPDSREFFAPDVRLKLWTEHPAHLHMNVDADFRGLGAGASLLQTFFGELRRERIPSAHLICGPRSVPFWERMGFRCTAVAQVAPGLALSAMTRPTD